MIDLNILRACAESWPERPSLRPAEWPYSAEELDRQVTAGMLQISGIARG